jgi:regulation of enolase protein 1 (concanavalin A-like superfamily)
MARKGNVFSVHYSLDGQEWRMVRLFRLDVADTVRVGIVAQCPSGPGTTVDFLSFSLEQCQVENIRAGV